jgi:hypothetical protein
VPDHPEAVAVHGRPVGAGPVAAPELDAAAGGVLLHALGDPDAVDRLAAPERDLAVGPLERAEEVVGDPLLDQDGAVRLQADQDVRRGQRERLGAGGAGQRERRRDGGRKR